MGVGVRKFNRYIKSLMHFDYPYFAEPGDGMRDEIGVLSWSAEGNAIFVGTEIPVAQNVAGTPKFGYRCLQTSSGSDYIESSVTNNYLDMKSNKNYEIEFFIRKTNASAGNIVNMLDDSDLSKFTISTDANNKIVLTCSTMSIAGTSDTALTLNTWTHVRVRISNSQAYIYVNGVLSYSGNCELEVQNITKIRLGGFIGQLDEFMIRHALSNDNVPGVPYKGYIDGYIDTYGIGGTGKQGALNLTSGTNYINGGVYVKNFQDSRTMILNEAWTTGIHGTPQVGDELFIVLRDPLETESLDKHPEIGQYTFKKIKSITGLTIELDSPITDFTADSTTTTKYNVYTQLVPNYTSVTIGANAVVQPNAIGYVLMRCKGDVNIQGKILTSGILTPTRKDYFQMTHNHLPERFIINGGGGVIILSEGTVTAGDSARIGASWSGSGKGGAGAYRANGNPGGSGYGGSGRSGSAASKYSGAGGVGGGGGGVCKTGSNADYEGGAAGVGGNTGGRGWGWNAWGLGGTQGTGLPGSLGGGGTLQDSHYGSGTYASYAYAGSCVMIICKKLKVSMDALSTGGAGGTRGTGANNEFASGGGGCGMCYLAYEEAE